jgi:hypothetical protein
MSLLSTTDLTAECVRASISGAAPSGPAFTACLALACCNLPDRRLPAPVRSTAAGSIPRSVRKLPGEPQPKSDTPLHTDSSH